jgi:gluconate 2-dehydrogenase gamma chain
MDRRKYLKSITLGTLGAGVILESCNTEKSAVPEVAEELAFTIDRYPEELIREKELLSEKFFNEHEMKTIGILSDIIIPKDEVSGSATEAGVPDFIEFIVKDMPQHQLPLRGGLKWLDMQCLKNFNNAFVLCSNEQQIEIIDQIAFPELAKPEMQQGVAFFNLMRNLTATGFFTSKIGIKDLGYKGNQPNQWDGVPEDVLQQYGMKYDARTLEISVKHDS